MRVRFTEDYDYRPTPGCTIAYKAGMEETVKRDCGEAAVTFGKAVEIAASKRVKTLPKEVNADGDQQ